MADKIINGDYSLIPNTNELVQCDYTDELFQNAVLLLKAHRGKFYPNKDFGSKITEAQEPMAEYLAAYAAQALDTLDGVYVKRVYYEDGIAHFRLMINDIERGVIINLENNL